MRLRWLVRGTIPMLLLAGCSDLDPGGVAGPEPEPAAEGRMPGSMQVVGRGPVTATHSSDIWVFQGVDGRDYAYTGTWGGCNNCFGDRMYAWDVTTPSLPVLTDSVVVDARVVNDVKVNGAGTLGVITREGASDRMNGIVVLDLRDPAHPTIASEYTTNLTGGIHNTYIDGNYVYAVNDGTRDVHIIDVSNPQLPFEVSRWGLTDRANRYLHDVWVKDGLAYLSYWNDGLVILDVGNGIRGGSPASPQKISQISYRTTAEGLSWGNTHVAFPYTNRAGRSYVFVGDEIFPPSFSMENPLTSPRGYIHVIDVTDVAAPAEVAKYEVPEAGSHNVWVADDILYVAYYNAGLRAVDVSGALAGDLRTQQREIAVLATTDGNAFIANRPFAWGPQPYKGLLYASDHNSGLWITRLNLTGGS